MVPNEILNLNVNKFSGPDAVHPRLLIEVVESISHPIALLLNKIVELGKGPIA